MKWADDVLLFLSPILQLTQTPPPVENKQDSGYLSHILPVGVYDVTVPHPVRL